jgi:hypothetical protein
MRRADRLFSNRLTGNIDTSSAIASDCRPDFVIAATTSSGADLFSY